MQICQRRTLTVSTHGAPSMPEAAGVALCILLLSLSTLYALCTHCTRAPDSTARKGHTPLDKTVQMNTLGALPGTLPLAARST